MIITNRCDQQKFSSRRSTAVKINMPRVKTDLRINEEISTLSSKISDIEQQLREERKVQAKLLHEAETKVVQLNSLNEEIKSEAGRFSEASQQIIKETADIEQSNKAKYVHQRCHCSP